MDSKITKTTGCNDIVLNMSGIPLTQSTVFMIFQSVIDKLDNAKKNSLQEIHG